MCLSCQLQGQLSNQGLCYIQTVKLISLNTLGGNYIDLLTEFITQQQPTTDIFCFQEIASSSDNHTHQNTFQPDELEIFIKLLPDFNFIYSDLFYGLNYECRPVDYDLHIGNALFYRKDLVVSGTKVHDIFRTATDQVQSDWSDIPRNLQQLDLNFNGRNYSVFNFHGQAIPGDKLDTEKRLEQSRKILKILPNDREVILVGDFNLMPATQSVALIETKLRNLISEYHIANTRGSLNPYAGLPDEQKYADFTFVSKGVNVTNFEVPDAQVSDHCPMVLEFD